MGKNDRWKYKNNILKQMTKGLILVNNYINSSSPSTSKTIRSLVQIPLTSCTITQNDDGTFHIAPKS